MKTIPVILVMLVALTASCVCVSRPKNPGLTGRWYGWDGGYASYLDLSPESAVTLTIIGMAKLEGTYRVVKSVPLTAELTLLKPEGDTVNYSAVLDRATELTLSRERFAPILFSRQPEAMFKSFRQDRKAD